jgi:NADH dehydrogenase
MILLTGGTGFLGSLVREQLVALDYPLRVMTRGAEDWRGTGVGELRGRGIDTVLVDLRNPGRVASAVEGCTAVINTVGILREGADATFEDVHVKGLQNLVAAAEVYGVQRFIHVSCLGTGAIEQSDYMVSKRRGEELVMAGQFHWTIFRPTFMFGQRCRLAELILPIVKAAPIVPVIGTGLNQVQPVSVNDVADCVVQSIYNKETAGKIYELAGPRAYSMIEFVQLLSQGLGRSKPTVNIPLNVALKAVKMTGRIMPAVALSMDVIDLLVSDAVADTTAMCETFQVNMQNFEDSLPEIVAGGRP